MNKTHRALNALLACYGLDPLEVSDLRLPATPEMAMRVLTKHGWKTVYPR